MHVEAPAAVLSRAQWTELQADHQARAHALLDPVIERRSHARRHPVEDFLFDYYNLRPGQLLTWHPGVGHVLADASEFAERRFYVVDQHRRARVDAASFLARRGTTVDHAATLLRAIEGREPRFTCFGMHEWAMVYRLPPEQTRHPYLRLRFGSDQIAEVVTELGVRCSHFDAFRFFTQAARPLNVLQPTRESQVDLDQCGCLHVNMDLYKWAGKLLPAVDSDLLLDCFELARDIRELDMRASAYDLREWGYEPVPVETADGRRDYVRAQRAFTARAEPLRRRLLQVIDDLSDGHVGVDGNR